ncbi:MULTISPECIES: M23 family metallopeptidase [unclassified Sphingopyxis]|uniref:M23 family metallopeptidase n=1 Tax=unclassified Sphingopyxis TaxID=2614943 RepID=UPI0028667C48|nr:MULTISPECIES: M23 family metallopeptidase [unclassified Sphingopyxis]MDR7059162.1 murein DD-endopeptidase MepM/ murein hydrolase activator NlpD [Sphingopyxis sp. BE235]MDR7178652.1 murein DD-endopeptidase MepM/ murein hydrolase activator NlpD [Sphingopyxis sp. BE249]
MGDFRHHIAALLCAASLAGCIPATPAPPSPPVPAPDFERRPIGEATGVYERPTWTLKPVTTNAVRVNAGVYSVRPGDTLRAVGEMTGAGSEALAIENDLVPPYALRFGQELRIPAGLYHRVGAGETGIGIAAAYDADWGEIITINALSEPYILRVGQRLRLPSDARVLPRGPVDVGARAAAFRLNIDDILTGSQPALAEAARPTAGSATPRPPVTTAIAEPAYFAGRFEWPLNGPILARFGPIAPGRVSDGINIAAAAGTPIRATAGGVVAYAGDQVGIYGGLILINHGGGWVSAYGHAGRIDVKRGQSVRMGDVIGRAGATGQVQTSQLHFQLRKNRIPVDPMKQLPPR